MRFKHVEIAIHGLLQTKSFPGDPVKFSRPTESLRWNLWRGRVQTAGTQLQFQWLMDAFAQLRKHEHAVQDQTRRALACCQYLNSNLANNVVSLANYRRRYRRCLRISTSSAEGCVDDIGNARIGKRRYMRWSTTEAHNVAIARAVALDGQFTVLDAAFAA